ncbi:MAG: DMT family transporter [Ramlibacter sp.]|nr:DMT family transporter [Ramlibacter sp.]
MSSALAWGSVLLAATLWGGGALVAQALLAAGLSATSLALARFALGVPLLWWWLWRQPTGERASGAWRRLPLASRGLVLATGVAMALNVSCWFAAIGLMGATLPTVMAICCAPLFVALVSLWRGYERPSGRLAVALLLALAGVLLVVWPDAGLAWPAGQLAGVALSLASAALQAAVVMANARMPRELSPVAASAWSMSAAALTMGLLVLPQSVTWPAGAWAWLGVGYTGVVTTSVAYVLLAWGARQLPPTASSVAMLAEPLAAALLAMVLFQQSLSPRQWAGAVLLGAAMALLAWRGALRRA